MTEQAQLEQVAICPYCDTPLRCGPFTPKTAILESHQQSFKCKAIRYEKELSKIRYPFGDNAPESVKSEFRRLAVLAQKKA